MAVINVFLSWLNWLDEQSDWVRLRSCVFDFGAIVRVPSSVKSLSCPHCLSKHATMATIGVFIVLNRCNILLTHGRTGRTFVFLCVWVWCCASCSMLREVRISVLSPAKILHWRWCVHVGCIDERSRWPWMNRRTFVFLCTWLKSCSSCLAWREVIMLLWFLVKTYYNNDDRRVFIFVASMERPRWPWANRRYVNMPLLAFAVTS